MNRIINVNSILKILDIKIEKLASDKVIFKICKTLLLGNKLNRSNI